MTLSDRLNLAIHTAAELHRDQVRRGRNRTPYVAHLYSTMHLVSSVTDDEDVLIASLLHDSLEDVPHLTKENLSELFGERVLALVSGVTEPLDASKEMSDQLPWLTRKEAYLINLSKAPKESAIVSCADKIHNIMSTRHAIEVGDLQLVDEVHAHFRNQRIFYEKVLTICTEKLGDDHILIVRFQDELEKVVSYFV